MKNIEETIAQDLKSEQQNNPTQQGQGVPRIPQTDYPGAIPPRHRFSRAEAPKVRLMEELCRGFCLSHFFRTQNPLRSLGITSSVSGEGKSFVVAMLGRILANDSNSPVLLVECDWENTHENDYFNLPLTPGLAEWLRGECEETEIRSKVNDNLVVIRAGNGRQDAVRLLQQISKRGFFDTLADNNEIMLIDLPPILTTSYGLLAAGMADALALVVQAGVTPANLVADACTSLEALPVEGIILNQVTYQPGIRSIARRNA